MKKMILLVSALVSFSGSLSLGYIEDAESENISKECRALAQNILKSRSQEKLVKAQIKEASGVEKKPLERKLEKIQVHIVSGKERFKLACSAMK